MLLLPADVLQSRRPDNHFADEAPAARDAGLELALVDHDALSSSGGAVRAVPRISEPATGAVAIYRGWMLRSEHYEEFPMTLAQRNNRAAHQP
jgi:hypothetical protein